MKITSLESWTVSLELTEPCRIAYETIWQFDNVILRATTDNGIIGWSCGAPDEFATGETVQSVMAACSSTIEPMLRGRDVSRLYQSVGELRKELGSQLTALAAADLLLWDLAAKAVDQPLYRLLGGTDAGMDTSVTIGILPVDETVKRGKLLVAEGFRILKIKGGLDVQDDIAKINRLREAVGNDIQIRFDANQGYSVDDAIHFVRATTASNLAFIEQPIGKGHEDDLGKIISAVDVPVMVDESVTDVSRADWLIQNGLTDMVNIKLMKLGGITAAKEIDTTAERAGIPTMVGCVDECELGVAFGLHFALSRPNVKFADLDSAFDIQQDPFRGLVTIRNGRLYASSEPGVGGGIRP